MEEPTKTPPIVKTVRARLIKKGNGSAHQATNEYEADGHLTPDECHMVQAELGFDPVAYDCFGLRHLVDPVLLTRRTIWKSGGSCE